MKTHHRVLGEDTCNAYNNKELYEQKNTERKLTNQEEKGKQPKNKTGNNYI